MQFASERSHSDRVWLWSFYGSFSLLWILFRYSVITNVLLKCRIYIKTCVFEGRTRLAILYRSLFSKSASKSRKYISARQTSTQTDLRNVRHSNESKFHQHTQTITLYIHVTVQLHYMKNILFLPAFSGANSPRQDCRLSRNWKKRQAFGPLVTRLSLNSIIFLQIFKFMRKLHFHDFGFGYPWQYFPDLTAHIWKSLASFSSFQVPRDLWGQRMRAIVLKLSHHFASSDRFLSRTSINQSLNLGLWSRWGFDKDIGV